MGKRKNMCRSRQPKRQEAARERDQEDAFARAFLCRGVSAYPMAEGEEARFHRICDYCGCEVWAAEGALWSECVGCGGI